VKIHDGLLSPPSLIFQGIQEVKGIYEVSHEVELSFKVDALLQKFDQVLSTKCMPVHVSSIHDVCASPIHSSVDYPSSTYHLENMHEHLSATQGFSFHNNRYSKIFNLDWRNHAIFFLMEVIGSSKVLRSRIK